MVERTIKEVIEDIWVNIYFKDEKLFCFKSDEEFAEKVTVKSDSKLINTKDYFNSLGHIVEGAFSLISSKYIAYPVIAAAGIATPYGVYNGIRYIFAKEATKAGIFYNFDSGFEDNGIKLLGIFVAGFIGIPLGLGVASLLGGTYETITERFLKKPKAF